MFGKKETKEEKAQKEIQKYMEKYKLEEISEKDLDTIREIFYNFYGVGLIETGMMLSGKSEDVAKIAYLKAIYLQNWIIIRKLEEISKKFDTPQQ